MIISCIAYDPVQDLLAVAVQANGASQGKAMPCAVIVFGGRAVERQFQVPNAIGDDAVAHGVPRILAFKPGDGLLLAVVGHNRLVAWNLLRGVVEYDIVVALPLGDKDCISTLEAPCGTRWVFVGMAGSGAVTVLDGERGLRTHFVILCQLVDDEKGASASRFSDFQPSDSAVVATLIHPHVADELLIGYAGGVVVVVSLRDQLILKRYDINRNAPPSSRIQLTALSWKYDGTAFAAGYTDGLIAIWSYDIELKPTMTFFIDDTPVSSTTDKSQKYSECRDGEAKVTHFPIYQLHWEMQSTTVTSSTTSVNLISPASVLIITGGSLQSGIALNGVRLLHIDERQSAILRQQFLATGDHEINQCLPFSLSPWFGMDSKAVALIHSDGSLALLSTVSNGTTFGSPSALPASLRLALSSPLDAFTVNSQLPAHAFNRLTLLSSPEQSILPMLDGGVTGLPRDRPSSISSRRSSSNSDDEEDNIRTSPTCNDVLITIHQDSTVRIWDASMSILRDLGMDLNLAVDLLDEMGDFTKSDAPGITLVDMAHFKGFGTVMWVALRDGVVLFFKFALETRADDQSSLTGCIDGIQEVRDGATPGFQRIWKVTRYAGKSIVDIVSGGDGLFMIIDESGRFSVMNVKTGKLESEGTVGNDRCEGVETSAITGPLITSSCLTTSYVKRTATDGKEEGMFEGSAITFYTD